MHILLSLMDDVYPKNRNSMTTNASKKKSTVSCQYCWCNDLESEVEETKLDLVIIESQLNRRILTNEECIA